jgi:predicted hydrocarbon binding protein
LKNTGQFTTYSGRLEVINQFLDKYIFTGGLKYVHNNFFLMEIPFLMVPSNLLISLSLKKDASFNREIYYSFKQSMSQSLKKQFGIDFKEEGDRGLDLVENFFTSFGWGLLKNVDVDIKKKRAIVIVNNSPVALKLEGKAKEPVDHFLRGILAGIFSDYFKTEVECVETKCTALNNNHCEFVIKEKKEFDFSKKITRNQLDTER